MQRPHKLVDRNIRCALVPLICRKEPRSSITYHLPRSHIFFPGCRYNISVSIHIYRADASIFKLSSSITRGYNELSELTSLCT